MTVTVTFPTSKPSLGSFTADVSAFRRSVESRQSDLIGARVRHQHPTRWDCSECGRQVRRGCLHLIAASEAASRLAARP